MGKLQTVLVITFKSGEHPTRMQEYNECLERNSAHNNIGKIVLFFEGTQEHYESVYKHQKIETIFINGRPTLNQFFEYANRNLKGIYTMISNADIYFDEESDLDRFVEMREGSMWVLTRWQKIDQSGKKWAIKSDVPGCYDTFVYKPPIDKFKSFYKLKFARGGMESYFVAEAVWNGIQVANPAKSIVSKHLHSLPMEVDHEWFDEKQNKLVSYHDLWHYELLVQGNTVIKISAIEEERYYHENFNLLRKFVLRVFQKAENRPLLRKLINLCRYLHVRRLRRMLKPSSYIRKFI